MKLDYCYYAGYPGRKQPNKRNRAHITLLQGDKCTVMNNEKYMYFCNTVSNGVIQNCHKKYHTIKCCDSDK